MLRHLPARYHYVTAWILAGVYNYLRDVDAANAAPLAVFNATHFLTWMVLGRLAIPLIRRHPLRLDVLSWVRQLALGSAFALADIVIGHWLFAQLWRVHLHDSLWQLTVWAAQDCFGLALLTYFCLVGVVQAWAAHQHALAREREAQAHQAAAAQAQLDSLQRQLQPHFLFNTLNTIAGLMHYDVATAERMLTRLSELLRAALREAGRPTIALGQELALVEAYLEIEQIRFAGRLQVTVAVPAALHALQVPPLILQPLVENAVKHAIGTRAAGGAVQVHAACTEQALVLEVRDDGGPERSGRAGFGIGLANTRARLATQFGPAARLELLRADGGTVARITLPLPALALAA